jgi:hypothetical protein
MGDLEIVPPPARRGAIGGKESVLQDRKIPGFLEMKK